MKQQILILTLIFSCFLGSAQKPRESTMLINKLEGLYVKENPTEAINALKRLHEIDELRFINSIHESLAQYVKSDNGFGNSARLLEKLYSQKIDSINLIITPLHLWNTSFSVKDDNDANKLLGQILNLLNDRYAYKAKTELYALLIVGEFDMKNIGDIETKNNIITQIQRNLEKNSSPNSHPSQTQSLEERAWARSILAYSYNYLYEKRSKKELYIADAARYSPDNSDLQNHTSYFYDIALLSGDTKYIGYRNKYLDYLTQEAKIDKAFNVQMEITFLSPTDQNMERLKQFHAQSENTEKFENLWGEYINSNFSNVPEVKVNFKSETLDFSKVRSNWIYIDFWGTWCGPCVRELPEFNKVALHYNTIENTKLKVYSFSCGSTNLNEFMIKNNYTFPVTEVDQEFAGKFYVSSFPTKILITPDNKYIKIPFGVDWHEYVKNYCLMN